MKLVWVGYFFEIGILALIKPYIVNFDSVAILAVIFHVIFTIIILFYNSKKTTLILVIAFIIRVVVLFWDLYGRRIFVLPNSGADSEMYYRYSVLISENLSLLGNTRGRIYSDINGLLFYLIGPQRIFGQYMNVLIGILTIFVIYKILCLVNINEQVKKIIICIIAFFPNSIIMSAIFLREAIPTFFVSLSLYYFIRWFSETKMIYMILAFVMLGISSVFHSGVIGIILGYTFTFLFYKRGKNKFMFSRKTITSFILIIIMFSLAFTVFGSMIFVKFQKVEEFNDIYQVATPNGAGDSAYLTGLQINNLLQLAIYGPIKSIYFLFSPLPLDWRSMIDVISFFTDSILYLGSILYFIKNRKKLGDRKVLAISIFVMIIGAAFIFGIGVSNVGTAMRHRQKLIPLFLILFAVTMDGKKLLKNKKMQ